MSGIRDVPSTDFIYKIVSIFYPNPDLTHITEIHMNHINQTQVIDDFIEIFPEIELYYYPSKLQTLVYDSNIPFESCITILRQLLRKKGYSVLTKTIKKRSNKEKVMIIRPPQE